MRPVCELAAILDLTRAVMVSHPRVALFFCSDVEVQGVMRTLADWPVRIASPDATETCECDVAIFGAFASARLAVVHALADKLTVPGILLLSSRDDNALTDRFASVSLIDVHRLPHVISRELRLHRAEEALRESERRYRQLIDQAQEGVWVVDPQGNTTFANQRVADMLGSAQEELTGASIFEFIDEEMRAAAVRDLHRGGGARGGHDLRFRRGDGSVFWALATASPLFDEHGRYTGTLVLLSDITARKQIEEELRRRDTQLTVAGKLASVASWEWDVRTDEVWWSRELLRMAGVEATGPLSLADTVAMIHPDDVERVREALGKSVFDGSMYEQEFRLLRPDGEMVHLHSRAQVVTDDRGKVVRIVGMAQDITERKHQDEALRNSVAQYRALVEQATDMIFSVAPDGRLTSLNPAFELLTGWDAGEWIDRDFTEMVAPESRMAAEEHFAAILGSGASVIGEYELRTSSGATVTAEVTAQALVIDGRVIGVVGIGRDVTSRKAAEAEREREKRLASLGQLAASVAHEFNNVLMSILPFAELLKRRIPTDDRVAMATNHIVQAVRRGRQISQEVLRFSRPTSPALVPLPVGAWLDHFAREASAMLGIKYRLTCNGAREQLWIEADRALLDQVATNLVINARDAMPEGGEVTVEVAERLDEDAIEISISDQGAGIPKHLIDRIFDPLFTTKTSGNGLGLTIAYQAMALQRGTLRVASTPGAGSTFTMRFRASAAPEPQEDAAPGARTTSKRVVVVEDDPSVGEGICALLMDEGFDVHLVTRGGEARKAVERFRPDIVLLDVNLPDVSGLDVYDELREVWPSLPVIFSTGHADARALEDVRKRHVPSIMKPYDASELLAVMGTC